MRLKPSKFRPPSPLRRRRQVVHIVNGDLLIPYLAVDEAIASGMDEIPATILRRRELFAELRAELDRLNSYPSAVSTAMDEQEMREALDTIERVLGYAEMAKQAELENARAEDDGRSHQQSKGFKYPYPCMSDDRFSDDD